MTLCLCFPLPFFPCPIIVVSDRCDIGGSKLAHIPIPVEIAALLSPSCTFQSGVQADRSVLAKEAQV